MEEKCATPIGKLKQVADAMLVEMHAGLASEGGSKLKMLISYVDNLPTGDENGLFYALDLGGTNFRVLRVKLGARMVVWLSRICRGAYPPNLMDWDIKSELAKFVAQEVKSFKVRLAIFLTNNVSEDMTRLDFWKIGWPRCRGAIDQSDGKTGCSYARISSGTGTNAAYVECAQAIPKWHGALPESGEMVINMEWGNFRSSHLPLTDYDLALDVESLNPGEQIFEKIISGMYLGEIVRRVLLNMAEEAAFFGDILPSKLKIPFILRTPDMSAMHHDTSSDLEVVGSKLKDILEIYNTSLKTRKVVVELCNIVATRGARLAAAGILGILKKMGKDTVKEGDKQSTVIALDGGLYEHYSEYSKCMENTLNELLGEEVSKTIEIVHSNDGSGIGAALLAASHSRYR
ncbi:hypothetical protein GH714_020328 [Hevea brasiliensis]|uniref:Phosphotransferase n=1 Tax=Hevea brasiliensis TaxID=3981 RepID=A0A6A6LKS1_HEVBR|nr:hypothetical protein GH714_020328 [Hevea brasiliensis]